MKNNKCRKIISIISISLFFVLIVIYFTYNHFKHPNYRIDSTKKRAAFLGEISEMAGEYTVTNIFDSTWSKRLTFGFDVSIPDNTSRKAVIHRLENKVEEAGYVQNSLVYCRGEESIDIDTPNALDGTVRVLWDYPSLFCNADFFRDIDN